MQRTHEKLKDTWTKISDGACHAQVRGGSGLGRFIASDTQPTDDDLTYLQRANLDWPGPEAVYVRAEGEAGTLVVWEED